MAERYPIVIRPERADDRGFVATRWRSSLRKRYPYRDLDPGFFHAAMGAIVDAILADVGAEVAIAALPDDDDVIAGFAVYDAGARLLHYLYTRSRLRGHGIASRLMGHAFEGPEAITATATTRAMRHHAERWNLAFDTGRLLDYTAPDRPSSKRIWLVRHVASAGRNA